jgi:hypothetical protein
MLRLWSLVSSGDQAGVRDDPAVRAGRDGREHGPGALGPQAQRPALPGKAGDLGLDACKGITILIDIVVVVVVITTIISFSSSVSSSFFFFFFLWFF